MQRRARLWFRDAPRPSWVNEMDDYVAQGVVEDDGQGWYLEQRDLRPAEIARPEEFRVGPQGLLYAAAYRLDAEGATLSPELRRSVLERDAALDPEDGRQEIRIVAIDDLNFLGWARLFESQVAVTTLFDGAWLLALFPRELDGASLAIQTA